MKSKLTALGAVLVLGTSLAAWADCGPIVNIHHDNPKNVGTCSGAGACVQYTYSDGSCGGTNTVGCATIGNQTYYKTVFNGFDCDGGNNGDTCPSQQVKSFGNDAGAGTCTQY